MRTIYALVGVAALTLANCAVTTGPRPAMTQEALTASATVASVDKASRNVVLVGADGERFSIVAGPEVRNLAQVKAGDTVTISYYNSTVLSMAAADAPQGTVVAGGRAPEGARPGGAALVATDAVVTVVSYDPLSGFARFRTDDGVLHTATVPPELRTFAERRAPGSRVKVQMTDAMAISVTEN